MTNDRIVIDVGGTKFVTYKKTLTAWTSAFDLSEDTLFLDADPHGFSVLLSFMRNGSVHPDQVTDAVLKQAIAYRVDGFVSLVRTMDCIKLNVRGRRIETSKKLLMEYSTYFREKFQKSWALEQGPFLNQDPVAFSVLLEFMTRGHVEQSKLTNEVLELAEVLGVEILLNAVKAKTCWVGNDEKSILKFNETYTSISNAISTCRGSIFQKQQQQHAVAARVEYASVYLYKRSGSARTSLRLPFRACVYGNVSPELLRMGDTINVLNRLSKEGYCLADAAYQESFSQAQNQQLVPGLGQVFAHILFVKPDALDQARRRSSIQSRILLHDNDDDYKEIVPHEFVALLRPVDEVHSSNATRLAVPSSDSSPGYWAGTQLRDPPDPTYHGAMAWLTNHGFTQQEATLNQAFNSALAIVNAMEKSGWATIMVFSKRIANCGGMDVAAHSSESFLPTIIESSSITSSITEMSLENGH
jgi:hypothetical protein